MSLSVLICEMLEDLEWLPLSYFFLSPYLDCGVLSDKDYILFILELQGTLNKGWWVSNKYLFSRLDEVR
jgi:hypothetical protein